MASKEYYRQKVQRINQKEKLKELNHIDTEKEYMEYLKVFVEIVKDGYITADMVDEKKD